MTKQEINTEFSRELEIILENYAKRFKVYPPRDEYNENIRLISDAFLLDKIADLQLQIEELKSLYNGFPPKSE